LIALIPPNATFQAFGGRTGQGFTFKWTEIGPDGLSYNYELRIHGPDPSAPPGSNAASGWTYRLQRTGGTVPGARRGPGSRGKGTYYMTDDGRWVSEKALPGDGALADATHMQTTAPTWQDLQDMYRYLGGTGDPWGSGDDGGSGVPGGE